MLATEISGYIVPGIQSRNEDMIKWKKRKWNKQGEFMKDMQQIVHFISLSTFFRIYRWTLRVTVNIFLAYFLISVIIRKNIDEYRPSRWQISQDRQK